MERLHKYLARCGVASRRASEELIVEGRVTVNGQTITLLGTKVSEEDEVKVDGRKVSLPKLYYVLLNKPKGYVSTMDDPQRRPTVIKLLPDLGTPVKPVGRLDMDSTGLLLCTNDGELAARLTHPRHKVEKEYKVIVRGEVTDKGIQALLKGVMVDGYKAKALAAEMQTYESRTETSMLKVVLAEGKNRQVRNMCSAIGHPVVSLDRVKLAFLNQYRLPVGKCRMLTQPEVKKLRTLVGLE